MKITFNKLNYFKINKFLKNQIIKIQIVGINNPKYCQTQIIPLKKTHYNYNYYNGLKNLNVLINFT